MPAFAGMTIKSSGRSSALFLMSSLLVLLLSLCTLAAADAVAREPVRMLVFTNTAGFRHDSIPAAVDTLRALGGGMGWEVEHGEDAAVFTRERLARYRVVVFANTTGDVLDAAQQAALRAFVDGGGGFVGIHAAADTEYGWPWYEALVGAWFESHPPGLQARSEEHTPELQSLMPLSYAVFCLQ